MGHPWTAVEECMLIEMAGDIPAPLLQRHYNQWAIRNGRPLRTRKALFVRLNRLGISRCAVGSWLTTGAIAAVLALPPTTVEKWSTTPGFKRQRFERGRSYYYIRRGAFVEWARANMFRLGGLDRARLLMLLEDEALVDEILTRHPHRPQIAGVRCIDDGRSWPSVAAAAKACHCDESTLRRGLQNGRAVIGLRFERLPSAVSA